MKKIFFISTLILSLIAIVAYYKIQNHPKVYKKTNTSPLKTLKTPSPVVKNRNVSPKAVKPFTCSEISDHLWTTDSNGLVIHVPNTHVTTVLKKVTTSEKETLPKGSYKTAGEEKGTIVFDYNLCTPIYVPAIKDKKNKSYYAAPFYVSNQGSGIFAYAGLFEYNSTTKASVHLDSYFLGDRIDDLKMTGQIQSLNLSYLELELGQNFSEKPSKKVAFQLDILNNLKFVTHNLNNYPSINIKPNQTITSPYKVKINSRGIWHASEGELGIINVVDDYGNMLGPNAIMMTTNNNWMKNGPAKFSTVLKFKAKTLKTGKIVIYNDPGPGDGEEAGELIRFEIPVKFN